MTYIGKSDVLYLVQNVLKISNNFSMHYIALHSKGGCSVECSKLKKKRKFISFLYKQILVLSPILNMLLYINFNYVITYLLIFFSGSNRGRSFTSPNFGTRPRCIGDHAKHSRVRLSLFIQPQSSDFCRGQKPKQAPQHHHHQAHCQLDKDSWHRYHEHHGQLQLPVSKKEVWHLFSISL